MSQDLSNTNGGMQDISTSGERQSGRDHSEGFGGMNYEQIRQPYDPNYKNRNRNMDERNDEKRPDE